MSAAGLYPGDAEILASVPPAPRSPGPRATALIFRWEGSRFARLRMGLGWMAVGAGPFTLGEPELPGFVRAMSILLLALGAALVVLAIRSHRRGMRAYERGVPGVGRVTYAGAMIVRWNRRHPFKVTWDFRASGRTYEGSIESRRYDDLADLMNRSRIPIVHDPADPSVNTVYVE